MSTALPDQDEVLAAIRVAAQSLGHPPSRSEFMSSSGMTEYQVIRHFGSCAKRFGGWTGAALDQHSD